MQSRIARAVGPTRRRFRRPHGTGIPAVLAMFVLAACGGDASRPPVPRRIVDLSPPLTQDVAVRRLGHRALGFLGTDGRLRVTPVLPDKPELAFGWTELELFSHAGAHIDAPSRLLRGGEPPGLVPTDKLIGPARLADLRWHDRQAPIEIADLELTAITRGDVLLLFTGYEPPGAEQWPSYPGISPQVAEWLVAKGVRAIATDMPALVRYERLSERLRKGLAPESTWAEYVPFFQAQVPVIAGLVNLGTLVGEQRVLFVGAPLPLMRGTGAPLRAVALVY